MVTVRFEGLVHLVTLIPHLTVAALGPNTLSSTTHMQVARFGSRKSRNATRGLLSRLWSGMGTLTQLMF